MFNFEDFINNEEQNKDNNLFINGNELFINDIEKNNIEKKLLKKNQKILNNSVIGMRLNGSNIDKNNTSKKLNRSMTGINIGNNSIKNIYNIYNNINNSINLNNKNIIEKDKNKDIMNKTSNNIYSKYNLSTYNKSKNVEEPQLNLNIPINKKNHKVLNISSLPNSKNENKINNLNITRVLNNKKNKSSANIRAKIKEIKKISNKISNIKTNNIPNINKIFFQTKKSPFHILNNNSSRVVIDEQLKLTGLIQKKSTSHGKGTAPSLPLNSQNLYFKKLNPLTKDTMCYYREIFLENNQNFIKYNPLKNIDFKSLCESPYNFIKSKINLNNSFDAINIYVYNNNILNNVIIKIQEIENTVVSSSIKKIIEIYRNYIKNKNMKNFSFEEFINKEYNLYPEMKKEDIEKSALNQNYNFSLITSKGKRVEFIICSYEEFKMWINGLAFIIKNKSEFYQKNKDY